MAAKSFALKRTELFLGKPLKGGESTNTHIRINTPDKKWRGTVHEIWDPHEKVITLSAPLLHDSGDTIVSFLQKINRYSTENARAKFENNVRVHWWDFFIYPCAKFIQLYIFKRGFIDGTYGFVHAMMMSFHSFQTRSKLWLLYKDRKQSELSQ